MITRAAVHAITSTDITLEIHADVESRSKVNLKTYGAYVYWDDPSTECLMLAYRIAAGPLQLWERGQPQPDDIRQCIADGAILVAHNAEFEMLAFRWLARHHGWLAPKKYRCTAAMAAALSLPRDLASLSIALDLKNKKDEEGEKLIKLFCVPISSGHRKGELREPEEFPNEYERFKVYCCRDVLAEEEAEERMIPLSDDEQEVYRLGVRINDRGLRIDRRSGYAALRLATEAKLKFDAEMVIATKGVVKKCSDAAVLHQWINDQGVTVASAAKADLLELLKLDVPFHVKHAVRLRLAAGKTSVSKIRAMLNRASKVDDRVRGAFVYHAASTGRFQSFGVNFANLPRPRRIFDEAHLRLDVLFRAIRTGDPATLDLLYGPDLGSPMHLLSDAVRGFIWAAPGKKLVVADYSGIEGAIVAWLAGEDWKLAAMAEIIADPSLPDMYRRTAAQIVGLSTDEIDKKHPLRQSVGKVSELALGFGGGVGAFASMARNYNVDLDALYAPIMERADDLDIIAATKRYKECCSRKERSTLVLSEWAWMACELIKRGWRASNPAIKTMWWELESAARSALMHPGTVFEAGRCKYTLHGGYLFCRLPSGRCLAYANPRLKAQVYASRLVDGEWAAAEVMEASLAEKLEAVGRARIEKKSYAKVTALGVDSVTRKFTRFALYGGLLAENNTQATARDILIHGMRHAERADYPVIGTVYDEIITEVDRDFGDADTFARLICQLPAWAKNLPLTAGGYEAKRYRKG